MVDNKILCLDVGNSQIFAGVYFKGTLELAFRYETKQGFTSDQIGIFLREALRENAIEPTSIRLIGIASVVPNVNYSLTAACIKYFDIEPVFINADNNAGLTLAVANPQEVGADRIANAVAAATLFPQQPLIIVDFGTATTVCAISSQPAFLGGTIMPGIRLSVESLSSNTALLSTVAMQQPQQTCGRTTTTNIQAGVFYGHLGAIKEITARVQREEFPGEQPVIIGTGGFAQLFETEQLFDVIKPNLVLAGIASIATS